MVSSKHCGTVRTSRYPLIVADQATAAEADEMALRVERAPKEHAIAIVRVTRHRLVGTRPELKLMRSGGEPFDERNFAASVRQPDDARRPTVDDDCQPTVGARTVGVQGSPATGEGESQRDPGVA